MPARGILALLAYPALVDASHVINGALTSPVKWVLKNVRPPESMEKRTAWPAKGPRRFPVPPAVCCAKLLVREASIHQPAVKAFDCLATAIPSANKDAEPFATGERLT